MASPPPASALAQLLAAGDAAALAAVLAFLPPADLGRACCVCRALRLAASAAPLWAAACAADWAEKHYVPPAARALLAANDAAAAFRLARADASRAVLTDEELLSFDWRFRFKAEAGTDWVARDPYWRQDGAASHIAFTADGRLRRTPPPGEQTAPWPEAAISWRWARFGAGRMGAPPGALLRCRVEDAPVPTYAVRRHPVHWGWIMESCWGVYSSFEPPRPGDDPLMDDSGLVVTSALQFREAFAYNAGFPLDEDDVAATNGGAVLAPLAAALASGRLAFDVFAAGALALRTATAAKAREWRVTRENENADVLDDLIYVGPIALGHADRGDGGRVSHVLLPRRVLRVFMTEVVGFGVPAAGVTGALGGPDEDWVADAEGSDVGGSDGDGPEE